MMNIVGCSRRLMSMMCRSRSLFERACVFSESLVPVFRPAAARTVRCDFEAKRCLCEHSSDSRLTEGLDAETENIITAHNHSDHETFNLDVLVSLLRQENAIDICVIKVPDHLKYTEYFIVVSGVSPRHLRAMAQYAIKVYKFLRKQGEPHFKIEGKDAEDWLCIDFGKMVIHFMLPESREKYELEKLWVLRSYDEQLKSIPDEKLPEDFVYEAENTKMTE